MLEEIEGQLICLLITKNPTKQRDFSNYEYFRIEIILKPLSLK